ncbi:hypothetical protein PIROE2DRAFT_69307 [Piromyces sp. E2]|nr:hypothetical protein PIROE2DRAFT_69307 [Piromyces sp. E2]|eukprot:OUM64039.1 hypothetical protein PIROE2DRAFT_69307 [Piromyces sp. E2]
MKSSFLLLLTLFVSALCSARKVTFRVICFGSRTQVKIVGGKKYTLPLYSNKDILYAGTISNLPNGDFKYYYVVDGVRENFERTFSKKDKSTYTEFFGRKDTVKSLPTFSYSGAKWNRALQKRFENTLVSITKQIMEPSKFKKVVQAHYDRYYDEMKWDFSFQRVYKPSAKAAKDMPVYKFEDFENGLTKFVGGLRFPLYSYNEKSYKALKKEFKF